MACVNSNMISKKTSKMQLFLQNRGICKTAHSTNLIFGSFDIFTVLNQLKQFLKKSYQLQQKNNIKKNNIWNNIKKNKLKSNSMNVVVQYGHRAIQNPDDDILNDCLPQPESQTKIVEFLVDCSSRTHKQPDHLNMAQSILSLYR